MRRTTSNSERRTQGGEVRTKLPFRASGRSLPLAPVCARSNSRLSIISDAMKTAPLLLVLFLCSLPAQAPARKKLLIIGEEKGYRHEAVPHADGDHRTSGQGTGLRFVR